MIYRINNFLGHMAENLQDTTWAIFRILVAAMFATHGYEKLFGENPEPLTGSGMTTLGIGELAALY